MQLSGSVTSIKDPVVYNRLIWHAKVESKCPDFTALADYQTLRVNSWESRSAKGCPNPYYSYTTKSLSGILNSMVVWVLEHAEGLVYNQ